VRRCCGVASHLRLVERHAVVHVVLCAQVNELLDLVHRNEARLANQVRAIGPQLLHAVLVALSVDADVSGPGRRNDSDVERVCTCWSGVVLESMRTLERESACGPVCSDADAHVVRIVVLEWCVQERGALGGNVQGVQHTERG